MAGNSGEDIKLQEVVLAEQYDEKGQVYHNNDKNLQCQEPVLDKMYVSW